MGDSTEVRGKALFYCVIKAAVRLRVLTQGCAASWMPFQIFSQLLRQQYSASSLKGPEKSRTGRSNEWGKCNS
jgi:hypothetical protein